MEIKNPDECTIVLIGDGQLKRDTIKLVSKGKAQFFHSDSAEAKELTKGHPGLEGNIAIVASKGSEDGEVGIISAVGDSLIIHCEDKIIPLKGEILTFQASKVIEIRERFKL